MNRISILLHVLVLMSFHSLSMGQECPVGRKSDGTKVIGKGDCASDGVCTGGCGNE